MIASASFLIVCLHALVRCDEASYLESQPTVLSGTKEHALYLWIHLSSAANATRVAKVAANLQSHVNYVSPPEDVTDETEVIAGVGFGQAFYAKVARNPRNFTFVSRHGIHGVMPATDGDIFFHAKSDSISKLFELAQEIQRHLPGDYIASFEDIYGFVYRNGRDLSGFIDGTENPGSQDHKQRVAVDKNLGGSFVLTQRWVHNLTYIEQASESTLENIIGRTMNDSIEPENKPPTSHVARMMGTTDKYSSKLFEIVRQSQPYGNLHTEAGLFFIAYANSTANYDFMLDNMVGKGACGLNDAVMTISRAVSGNLWYFPGVAELSELA